MLNTQTWDWDPSFHLTFKKKRRRPFNVKNKRHRWKHTGGMFRGNHSEMKYLKFTKCPFFKISVTRLFPQTDRWNKLRYEVSRLHAAQIYSYLLSPIAGQSDSAVSEPPCLLIGSDQVMCDFSTCNSLDSRWDAMLFCANQELAC